MRAERYQTGIVRSVRLGPWRYHWPPQPILQLLGHWEPRLRPCLRQPFRYRAQQCTTGHRGLHEQLIVAHQRDDFLVDVQRMLAEHFSERHGAGTIYLVARILNETEIRGRQSLRVWVETSHEHRRPT